jgi:SET domain-containing protein
MVKRVKTIPKLMYEIRPSRAFRGEVGTFAVRNIKKGTIVDDVDSPEEVVFLKKSDFKKLDLLTRRRIKRFCVLDEDEEYCVPADLNNMGASWYFNHSCDSNIAYDKKGNFIADRDIKAGEELFVDYGRMYIDPKLQMKCACGAPNCRRVITGNDWLDQKFRKKNITKMWPEMRKLPK